MQLFYNDTVGHYGDNTGSYTAHISATPAAHPPKESCGKAVDVEIEQTPQTPLWDLDTIVTLNPAQINLPGYRDRGIGTAVWLRVGLRGGRRERRGHGQCPPAGLRCGRPRTPARRQGSVHRVRDRRTWHGHPG